MKWFKKNWLWLLINLLALLPIINLVSLIETSGFPKLMVNYPDGLLENPALKGKEITPFWFPIHSTGEWAIRWLTFSLICTPLNILFGWKQILKVRKTTGLWAFTYSLVHVLFFIWERNLLALFEEVKFILGLISFSIMLPLALISNKKSHRPLKKTWVKLHRYAYVAGILAVILGPVLLWVNISFVANFYLDTDNITLQNITQKIMIPLLLIWIIIGVPIYILGW